MQFSLLDFEINNTCEGMNFTLHPPHLINVATLPCEIRETENACEHNFSL